MSKPLPGQGSADSPPFPPTTHLQMDNDNYTSAVPKGSCTPNESDIYNVESLQKWPYPLASINTTVRRKGPVATSTKQMAGYFTVSGI